MKSLAATSPVVLINPWQFTEKEVISRVWPPLSLANCAAILRENGFDVSIIDANADRLSPKEVALRLQQNNAQKVFITSTPIDRWQCPYVDLQSFLECIQAVRKSADAKIYVMGAHGTVEPERILQMTKADAVIIGEPELTVLEICKKSDLKRVKGICYKLGRRIVVKRQKRVLDLDKLPMPAFDLLPMKKYFYELLGKDFVLLETSRGCPFDCVFCLKAMYGRSVRKKSVGKMLQEIERVIESGVKNIYFIDLEFTLDKSFVRKLCDFLIRKRKEGHELNWCCQTRADTVDYKLLQKMRDAGCKLVHFGVESGSPRMMKVMNKMMGLEKIEAGVKMAMDAGIEAACFFMFGLPTETKEEMRQTIELAKRLNPTYASFHVAMPYTGTKFANSIRGKGYDKKAKRTKRAASYFFPLCDPSRDYDELHNFAKQAHKQFYMRPSYVINALKRNPKLLTKQFKLFLRYIR